MAVSPAPTSNVRLILVWEDAVGEFQPFKFTAYWKNGSGSTSSEYVEIDENGDDVGPSHSNIRYHLSTVTLCDGFAPSGPAQQTGTHNGNTCIDAVVYNFDVRRFKDGDTAKCWVGSQGLAHEENDALDAVRSVDCGDSADPWTFVTQKNQNLNCRHSVYLVKYSDP